MYIYNLLKTAFTVHLIPTTKNINSNSKILFCITNQCIFHISFDRLCVYQALNSDLDTRNLLNYLKIKVGNGADVRIENRFNMPTDRLTVLIHLIFCNKFAAN